tara:strand:- start:751 stop:1203 length:453 start_codon:yes stop_codon:yes gene_type:complete
MRRPLKPSGRKRSPFYWWRRFRSHKYLPHNAPLLRKIQNGDYDYPPYFQQAQWELEWADDEQEQYIKNYVGNGNPRTDEAYEDIGRRARKRYKKLIEDGYEVESRHLSTLVEGLSKRFKLPKETIKTLMGEFGGTIEELYIDIKRKKNKL